MNILKKILLQWVLRPIAWSSLLIINHLEAGFTKKIPHPDLDYYTVVDRDAFGQKQIHTLLILHGRDYFSALKNNSNTAKLFAKNLSQINTPLFKLQDKYSWDISLSFFAPQGFPLDLGEDKEVFKKIMGSSGHWEIQKSDYMKDFHAYEYVAFEDYEDFIREDDLAMLYKDLSERPQHDSIVVFKDQEGNFEPITLTEIINRLSEANLKYHNLDVIANRINYYGHNVPGYMKDQIFGESLDIKPYHISYNIDLGFVNTPDKNDEIMGRERFTVDVRQWWQNLRSGLQQPKELPYIVQKILYASLTKNRALKEKFFESSYNNHQPGTAFLDNELTPKIQSEFYNFLETIPSMDEISYHNILSTTKEIDNLTPKENRVRIIFAYEQSIEAARRLALHNPNNTYLFSIRFNPVLDHHLRWTRLPHTSEMSFSEVAYKLKPIIFDKNMQKRFIFIGPYHQNVLIESNIYNYQKEGLATKILYTMIEKYSIYPNEVKFINYFDSKQENYVPDYFMQAITKISQQPTHQANWRKMIEPFRGSTIMDMMKIDQAHLITPSGTLLKIKIPSQQKRAIQLQKPEIIWNWFSIASDDRFSDPFIITHFNKSSTVYDIQQPLLRRVNRNHDFIEGAYGSQTLFKAEQLLHLKGIASSIQESLPLSDEGATARQGLWNSIQSDLKKLDHSHSHAPAPTDLLTLKYGLIQDLEYADIVSLKSYNLLPLGTNIRVKNDLLLPGDGDEELTDEDLEEIARITDTSEVVIDEEMVSVEDDDAMDSSGDDRRCKRSALRLCTSDETKSTLEKPERTSGQKAAHRLVGDYERVHKQLTDQEHLTTEIRDTIAPATQAALYNTAKPMLEPMIDNKGEVRLLSYQRGKIVISDPIADISRTGKEIIRDFNKKFTEIHQSMGTNSTLNMNHFWLSYAAANYAQKGISTDIRSLLNAAVFFPNLLLESTRLPVSLVHQLKNSDILTRLGLESTPLRDAIQKLELRANLLTSSTRTLGKSLSRFGSGVVFYNFVDDFLQKPDFATATTEEKTLWGLSTATDGIFATESAASLIEEFTLFALPGAELLGPLGLGLFAITEAVELAYKEHQNHQLLEKENHWLKVERDHYLQGACNQVKHHQTIVLDCGQTTLPVQSLRLGSQKATWHYGDLLLSKTIIKVPATQATSKAMPVADPNWRSATDLIPIFQKMTKDPKWLTHQAQIVIMPGMPHKQVYYDYQSQDINSDSLVQAVAPLVGSDNQDIALEKCLQAPWIDYNQRKWFRTLATGKNPEQLAFCLQLLTHHRFCPEIVQSWSEKPSCQVSYGAYNTFGSMVAVNHRYQYHYTRVNVKLEDRRSYVLVTPKLTVLPSDADLKIPPTQQDRFGNVKYFIQGNGQHNTLIMQTGFQYRLRPKTEGEAWLLVAPPNTVISMPKNQQQSARCGHGKIDFTAAAPGRALNTAPLLASLCVEGRVTPQFHVTYAHPASQ